MFGKSNTEHYDNQGKLKATSCEHEKQASCYGCCGHWST